MTANYAPKLPQDKTGNALQEYPAAIKAKAAYSATVTVSSVITMTDNTTAIEVGAIGGGGVAIKWIATSDTQASVISSGAGANYDHLVPGGTYRRFVVPIETQGTASIVGVNKQLGLYNRVAWVNATATSTSVFGTEY